MLKQIRAGVLRIAYLESGPSNGPIVLLLHGFPYDVHAYDAVGPVLVSKGCHVIIPYLRGYGPTQFLHSDTPRSGQQAVLAHDLLAPKSAGALIKSDGLSFGLKLGRHAQLERMVEKGVTKPMIDAALRKGQTFWDPARKTLQFVLNPTSGKMVGVSVNPATKTITTVMRQSRRLVRPRYQQISREAVEQMLK